LWSAVLLHLSSASWFGPSILCVIVVRPGEEAKLLAQQFLEGIGVFSCDDYILFSSVASEELFAAWKNEWGLKRWPVKGPIVEVLETSLDVVTGGEFDGPLNIPVYDEVWRKVYQDGRYTLHDWTLKLELFTVLHPTNLKNVLQVHCSPDTPNGCPSMFLTNDGPNLHSPIEALTSGAVEKLGEQGLDFCKREMSANWTNQSEDAYLLDCFKTFAPDQIVGKKEPNLLMDFKLQKVDPHCDTSHGSFWQFDSWGATMSCLGQAGYSAAVGSNMIPAQIAWTKDILEPDNFVKPTIFCWALIQATGQEPELLKWQRLRGLGIFGCDDWMLISNRSAKTVLGGQSWNTVIHEIEEDLTAPRTFNEIGGTLVMEAANAGIYEKAWRAVFADARYRQHDWTVQLKPQTVIVPHRFRDVLHRHCLKEEESCQAKVLADFGGDMRDPVEALTRKAAVVFSEGIDQCTSDPSYRGQSDFQFLEMCSSKLNIPQERDSNLLSDNHKAEYRPCDTVHGSFSPFADVKGYDYCLQQTGYYYIPAPATTTYTTTRTSTSVTHTSTSITTTTITTSTMTSTIPQVIPQSIWYFEGEDVASALPPWVVTWENYANGYPLAGGVLLAITSVVLAIGLFVRLQRRQTPSASGAPAAQPAAGAGQPQQPAQREISTVPSSEDQEASHRPLLQGQTQDVEAGSEGQTQDVEAGQGGSGAASGAGSTAASGAASGAGSTAASGAGSGAGSGTTSSARSARSPADPAVE